MPSQDAQRAGCAARARQEAGPRTSQDFPRRRARRRQDLRDAHGGARREGRRARRRRRVWSKRTAAARPGSWSRASRSCRASPSSTATRSCRSSISTPRSRAGPSLLLVDEYAHTNVPGSRHPKRWQDIEELLAAGIDVWTTLNIQHLESLNDVIQKITHGARARNRARHRVRQGRRGRAGRFSARRAAQAARRRQGLRAGHRRRARSQNFFKPQNLTALRELALRRAAERVDADAGRADAGAGDRRAMGRRRAHPRLRRAGSDLAERRAHRQAPRRPDGRAVAGRDGRTSGRGARRCGTATARRRR